MVQIRANLFSGDKENGRKNKLQHRRPTKMLSTLYSKSMATIGRRVPAKLQPLWKHEAGNLKYLMNIIFFNSFYCQQLWCIYLKFKPKIIIMRIS